MFILDTFARVFICMFKASSVSILKKRKRNKYVATQCPFLEAIKYIFFFFNNSLQHANSCKCLQWRTRTFSWKTFKCSSGGFCEVSLWQVSPHGSRGGGDTFSVCGIYSNKSRQRNHQCSTDSWKSCFDDSLWLLDVLRGPCCEILAYVTNKCIDTSILFWLSIQSL